MPNIYIYLNSNTGIGTLKYCKKTYDCGVDPDYNYPEDSTLDGRKEKKHHSNEYDVDMPWAVLWDGTDGIYFHEADSLSGSAGCIHLLEGDAEDFYNSVQGRPRILFKWVDD